MKRFSGKLFLTAVLIAMFSFTAVFSCGSAAFAYVDTAELPEKYLLQWFDAKEYLDYEGTLALVQSQILTKTNIRDYEQNPIVIAVIDTGIDFDHSVFDGLLYTNSNDVAGDGVDNDGNGYIDDVCGWDFVYYKTSRTEKAEDNDASDDCTRPNSHGTHVAGIIAKEIINYGLQDYVKILPLKAGSADGSFSKDGNSGATENDSIWVVNAINYAVAMGADVINMSFAATVVRKSWGTGSKLDTAVQAAHNAGIILVAAAGNEGTSLTKYSPACLNNVIGVMNMDVDGSLQEGSNSGTYYDVVAPGTQILSSVRGNYLPANSDDVVTTDVNGNKYAIKKGTSMAAPIVSFMAAVLMLKYDCDAATVNYIFDNCAEKYVNYQYKIASLTNYLAYKPVTAISVEVTHGSITQKITDVSEIKFSLYAKYLGSDLLAAPNDDIVDDIIWSVQPCDASGNEISTRPAQYFYGATMTFTPPEAGCYNVYARLGKYDIGRSNAVLISVDYATADEANLIVVGEKGTLRVGEIYVYNVSNIEKINPSDTVYWMIYFDGEYLTTKSDKQLVFSPSETGNYKIICKLSSGTTIEEIESSARISKKTATNIGAGVGAGLALIIIATIAAVNIVKAKRLAE